MAERIIDTSMLTAEANAIRTKGISGQIEYKSNGFADAILAIPSGGEEYEWDILPYVVSLNIVTAPTKVSYNYHEALNLAGMTVSVTYNNGNTKTVTNYTTVPANGTLLSYGDSSVSVSYTEDDITVSNTVDIFVKPTLVVTAPTGSTVTATKSGTTLTASEVSGTWTFNIPEFGTWTVNATKGSSSSTDTINIASSGNYNITLAYGPEIVPWSSTDDAKILAMINALDSGQITVADTGWKVGDTRTVNLSAMSATGVGESHAAQSVQFVLMDATLQGMSPASSSKPLHFAVGMKDCLKETGYMNSSNTSSGGWNGSARRTWCNATFANSLPSNFKACFRQFTWQVGKGGGASSGLTTSTDLFALPVEKQIFGSRTYSQSDEANLYNQWTWYATSSNRVKKVNESAYGWWEASPYSGGSSTFCTVSSDGTAYYGNASASRGVAPFGCI